MDGKQRQPQATGIRRHMRGIRDQRQDYRPDPADDFSSHVSQCQRRIERLAVASRS